MKSTYENVCLSYYPSYICIVERIKDNTLSISEDNSLTFGVLSYDLSIAQVVTLPIFTTNQASSCHMGGVAMLCQ